MPEHVGPTPGGAGRDRSSNTVATASVIAALLTAAVVGTLVFRMMAGGDEPPIRVRGGSIHLDLNGPDARWEQIGSTNEWKIKGDPKRDQRDFYFEIDPATVCPANGANKGEKKGTGKIITLTYSDGTEIVIEVKNNKRTRVMGPGLALSNTDQTLSLNRTEGFLLGIAIDGQKNCTFTSKDDFKGMGLFDYEN